ncbi:FAD-dependent oxidoreductase [Bifidobacterium pullorum]|nr:FAD-dependent oxidoreductase [Bifidobacterium pullorum]
MKVVIIGGVAGGATAATRLRRLDEHAEIVMLDKGLHVSFSNCSLPFRLSGAVDATDKLVMMTPQAFAARYAIDARTMSEATAIDRAAHTVHVRNLADGSEYDESYDKLILSPGAAAVIPPIDGIDGADVFPVKTVVDVDRLHTFLTSRGARRVSVVGGGFIGVEVAVNLAEAGYQVSLVEAAPQILATFDHDMVQILHKAMVDHGVDLIVGDQVSRFDGDDMTLASGRVVGGDAVVMAVGIRPNTAIAAAAGLDVTDRGLIRTDADYRTADPDIYAIGDAIEVTNALTGRPMALQLAGPAQKQARQVADHICGRTVRNTGYLGSNCIRVFDWNAAGTGLTAAQCEREGLRYDYAYVIPQDKVSLMPDASPLHLKLIFEVPTGRVLGAQAIGKGDAVKRMDVVATAIKFGATVDDLRDLELCYAPPFSNAKDPVNMAALVAGNLLDGDFRQVHVDQARGLVESGATIIDVRDPTAFQAGHLKGAVNIPLAQLRDRLDEVPRDRTVYLNCMTSQTSYTAIRLLQGHGFTNVVNMAGSMLGISLYEWFTDRTTGREPIVTGYCG